MDFLFRQWFVLLKRNSAKICLFLYKCFSCGDILLILGVKLILHLHFLFACFPVHEHSNRYRELGVSISELAEAISFL